MSESSQPVITEQSFSASKESLWNAISQHDQIVQWFFEDVPAFEARTGFETQFDVDTGQRTFRHLWKLIEVVPQQKIVYDWRYEGITGAGTVTFELFDEADGSRLRVTNEGIESFPKSVPEFTRESAVDGWKYLVQDSLKRHLDGDNADE